MIHFLFLISFALIVSTLFAVFTNGNSKEKLYEGLKYFGQFVGISLLLAWIFYFLPW